MDKHKQLSEAAKLLGSAGGLKAAENMTKEERVERAKNAVKVRIENRGQANGEVKVKKL